MNRRHFLQACGSAAVYGAAVPKPNIVFVLTDQWRAQAFGYTGDPNAHTPAIDSLAAESVSFRNAVSGLPVCSPYRGCLMTGQYAATNGLVVNDVPLKPNGPTLGESFRKAAYATAYIGKWHLYGSPDGFNKRRLSFVPPDARFGFEYWKACECTHDYNRSLYYEGANQSPRYWEGYDAIAQTEDACRFIASHARSADPYFLLLSLGPPHDPYGTAPDRYAGAWANRDVQLRPNVPESRRQEALKNLRGYYAHGAALDDCVKRLKDAVDRSGRAEDTIFVFTSDHGDMLQSQGLPLKQHPWDESIRVPFLVRYPRSTGRRGRELITPIDAPDIMPTLLGLAGLRAPENVQGRDFSALITGKAKEESEPFALLNLPVSFSVIRRHGFAEYRGVRTPRHTYVRSIHGSWLLYDNVRDPYQMRNLAGKAEHAALQSRLDRMLEKRLKAVNDDFLPGPRYVERANASHYREVNAAVGRVESPWGDWSSNMQ